MSSTAGLLQKLFITVVVLGAYSGIASAVDDQGDDWRDKALALNDVTGDDPIKERHRKLDQEAQRGETATFDRDVNRKREEPTTYRTPPTSWRSWL